MGACAGQTLCLVVTWEPDGAVVTASGEIDLSTVDELTGCLDTLMERGAHRISLDLSTVTFLGAAGLNALLHAQAAAAAEGGALTVSASSGPVEHLMDVTATAARFQPDETIHLDGHPAGAVLDFVTDWSSPAPSESAPSTSDTSTSDTEAPVTSV
jgi:anti-anti-sigma factor